MNRQGQEASRVSYAALTDVGRKRPGNEDALRCRPDLGLFIVADGMGGHAAGEVASRMAADVIEAFADHTRDADTSSTWPFEFDPSLSVDANRLRAGFRLANRRLSEAIEADDALYGMGTTGVALLITDTTSAIAHVGDSRAYLWRDGTLRQLTRDHSWTEEQRRAGLISDAGAAGHPWRHVVTRALMGGPDPEVDVSSLPLRPGDRLVLCTDGLSGVIAPEALAESLAADGSLEDCCRRLVDAANDAGGPDNITVIVLEVRRGDDDRRE